MQFQDRELTCLDCSQPFTFTAGEQEFYERKGFKEEPKRCKPCRENRKARRNGDAVASGGGNGGGAGRELEDDNIGNRAPRGPRPARPVQGGGGGGGGRQGSREMYDAVCAQCGAPARVPFKPVAGRPVYCRDCFGRARAGGAG